MNESNEENDMVAMEVDLRSTDPSERTLHWFINDHQQKVFFSGLPEHIEFAVCFI